MLFIFIRPRLLRRLRCYRHADFSRFDFFF